MNKIQNYYDIYLEDYAEDFIKHNYSNLSDSPYFIELRLLAKSINLYRDYLGLSRINLRAEIMHGVERSKR